MENNNFEESLSVQNFRKITNSKNNIFRSASIDKITSEEELFLYDNLKISAVIDLRTIDESSEKPTFSKLKYYNFPLARSFIPGVTVGKNIMNLKMIFMIMKHPEMIPTTEKIYEALVLPENKEQWQKIFEAILNHKNVLIYCEQGKDRTGVVCGVIEKILGFSDNEIKQDYLESEKFAKIKAEKVYKKMRRFLIKKSTAEKISNLYHANEKSIEYVFEFINKTYGSFENFLFGICGLNQDKINTLKSIYS